jgi:magnesium transporter
MRLRPTPIDLARLRQALNSDPVAAAECVGQLTAPELADVLMQLAPFELAQLESHLGTERLADAVAELDASEAARLILRFSRSEAAEILEEMDPDDATDVVEGLKDVQAEGILAAMRREEAEEIRELLAYRPETAGGLMTPQFVSISPNVTVAVAMRLIRAQAPSAETIYYIYVTDTLGRLQGVVSLRDLVVASPQQLISHIMRRQVIRVPVSADQEEAARLLMDHDFLALPVVDPAGQLLGVITADDVADVLQEEATEDIQQLGGAQPLHEPYLGASLRHLFRKRVVWLLALFVAALQTSAVLQLFRDDLERVVALAFFVPLLIGTGGNVGSQVVTSVVRGMAVGEVRFGDWWRVLRREMLVGTMIGLVMGGATFIRAETMAIDPRIAAAVGIAALFIVVWSASVAALLPLGLRRVGLDPAVASAPLITTLVDGTGLLIYFSVARLIVS